MSKNKVGGFQKKHSAKDFGFIQCSFVFQLSSRMRVSIDDMENLLQTLLRKFYTNTEPNRTCMDKARFIGEFILSKTTHTKKERPLRRLLCRRLSRQRYTIRGSGEIERQLTSEIRSGIYILEAPILKITNYKK